MSAAAVAARDHGDHSGIVSRAHGYGMHCVRVDGNDLFAVHEVTKKAREICVVRAERSAHATEASTQGQLCAERRRACSY